jgi:uncharacterized protein YicC (UPF0701 family)
MATKVKQAMGSVERILLPRLNSIDGELRSINTRIDSGHASISTRIDSVNTRIDEMDKRNGIQFDAVRNEIRALSEKVDLVKDVERLKIEVAELKRRP